MCDFIIHCTSRFMWKTFHHLPRFNRWLLWTPFTNCSPIYMTKWRVSCCGEHFLRADFDFLIKSGQEVQFDWGGGMLLGEIGKPHLRSNIYIEWGMYALQGCFPQLHDSFRSKRQGREKPCCWQRVVLYNFEENKVGFNQILNMYMPALSKDANHQLQQSINGLVHINMLLYLL